MSGVFITRLSSKGQIVVPKELRDKMDLKEGETFIVFGKGDTIVFKRLDIPSGNEMEKLLVWGENFAKQKGITKEQVVKAVQENRE